MKIKNFLSKIWMFILNLWNAADKIIDQYTPIAIKVVEEIKKINESTTGDIIEVILTRVIPGSADDAAIRVLRDKLRAILPRLLLQLNIVSSIGQIEDPNEQLRAVIATINMSADETRNAYYHVLCSLVLEALTDGKITWSEAVHISEYYYTKLYKK